MKFSLEFNIFVDAGGKDPIDQIKWGWSTGSKKMELKGKWPS